MIVQRNYDENLSLIENRKILRVKENQTEKLSLELSKQQQKLLDENARYLDAKKIIQTESGITDDDLFERALDYIEKNFPSIKKHDMATALNDISKLVNGETQGGIGWDPR